MWTVIALVILLDLLVGVAIGHRLSRCSLAPRPT